MPNFVSPEIVKPERKIEPQPFQLQCDLRGEKYQKEFRDKVMCNLLWSVSNLFDLLTCVCCVLPQ